MAEPPLLDLRQGMDSERRVVTILCADISGFADLPEQVDAEAATDIMNTCFAAIGRIAERRGAFVDKFIGTCAMVLFGAPRTIEGASDEALRSAMEIREAIEKINAKLKPPTPLGVRCGINTGTVIAGRFGTAGAMSYTVTGEPVAVAFLIKDAAEPGRILVGGETRAKLRGSYALVERRGIVPKGKSASVWELLCANERAVGDRKKGRSAFVGRGAELSAMERALLGAANGSGSLLIVSGEGGSGKSRLIEQLVDSPVARGSRILVGRCRSNEAKTPYFPFMEAIKVWAGADGRSSERLAKKIDTAAAVENAEVAPLIASMLGLPLPAEIGEMLGRMDAGIRERLTHNAVRLLLSGLAGLKPLVFIVEDLHFADESSLELLASCLRFAETKPILFILTARPDYPASERWLSGLKGGDRPTTFKEIRLSPLDPIASASLVDSLVEVRDFDPELRRRIVERAGGNPRFIEELVRSFPGGSALPSTIEEAFMVRIDRLDGEAKEILRTASVVGANVRLRVLYEAMPDFPVLCAGLMRLADAGFLVAGSRNGEIEYSFLSEAARDVAYSSLVPSRRKGLHRRVADSLERLYAGRENLAAGTLALHYSLAEIPDKAEAYMTAAGEWALKSAAANEAISHYRDALELCLSKGMADREKIDRLENIIAAALYRKGRYREALPYFDRLLKRRGFVDETGSVVGALRVAAGWATAAGWVIFPGAAASRTPPREIRDVVELVWQKCAMLAALGELGALATMAGTTVFRLRPYGLRGAEALIAGMILIAFLLTWSGKSPRIGARMLRITRPLLRPEYERARVIHLAVTAIRGLVIGDYRTRVLFRDPLVAAQGGKEGLMYALHTLYNACIMSLEVGDQATFIEAKTLLSSLTERFDTNVGRGCLESLAIRALLKRRDLAEAERTLPRLVDFFARTGNMAFRALAIASRIALFSGDLDRAVAEYRRAERARRGNGGIAMGDGYHYGAGAAIAVERARAAAEAGRRSGPVFRHGRKSVRNYLANSRKFVPDLPEALKLAGSLAWHAGKADRAVKYWRASIAEAERRGAVVELAHTLNDAGNLLADRAPGPEWRKRGAAYYSVLRIAGV